MTEFINDNQAIGWVFLGAAIVIIALELRARKRRKQIPQPIYRRIVEIDDFEDIKLVTMECGHIAQWHVQYPNESKCDICTREVAALRKMAGER